MSWIKEDTTFNDIREKSAKSWLEEMSLHEDIAVRCGVKLMSEYIDYLKEENLRLQSEIELRNTYLKKMKDKSSLRL